MKHALKKILWTLAMALGAQSLLMAQPLTGYAFKIVNMMPNASSDDVRFDSETNIAVDPAEPNNIVGSAFTRNLGSNTTAPIFTSQNGGNTWSLQNIVPSGNGMTGDITVDFAGTSHNLYTGILRGGSSFRCMVLRTANPFSGGLMTTLQDRNTESVDQPYVSATTVADGMGTPQDRVFVGDNNISSGGNGRTAEVMVSNAGTSAPPSGFNTRVVEVRSTNGQDFPAIRAAIHNSGVVYSIFYRWVSGNVPSGQCDVVVVRDDNFASGASQFANLTDPSDGLAGRLVATNRVVPGFPANLGGNRLVGSNLAVAVDPSMAARVFVAWCDRVGTTDYTVHLRRSANSGTDWTDDLLTITNATNPTIAVDGYGHVGFMYQQLTGSGATARWETHFRMADVMDNTFSDDILSSFLDSDLSASTISPALGDYMELQAVGKNFYAVFPASNRIGDTNWPLVAPTNARNYNAATGAPRNLANTADVAVSVDPYFVKIYPQLIYNICKIHPEVCRGFIVDRICRFPPFPCFRCPGPPCLSCPFEISFEDIIRDIIKDKRPETKLSTPYIHLYLDGYSPKTHTLSIVNQDHDAIPFQLNETEKGYAISFRAPKANYDRKMGLHGVSLSVLPVNEAAAKREVKMEARLGISDYKFREFNAKGGPM